MLEEFDRLGISFVDLNTLSKEEIKDRVKKRHELIKKMTDEEFNIIIRRRIPVQAKIAYSKIRRDNDN